MTQSKPTLHVRKGDRVKVISGKDRGLVGEVIAVYPERNKVTVAGVNIVKRHLRDSAAQPQAPDHQGAASSPRRRRSMPRTSSWW
jgi:large subunit ribosomal protein L24